MTDAEKSKVIEEIYLKFIQLRQLLDRLAWDHMPEGNVPAALRMIANTYGVSVVAMCGKSKAPRMAWARNVAQYVLKEGLGLTYTQIAGVTGFSHASNVCHSIQKVEAKRKTSSEFDERIRKLIDAVMTGKHRAA